MNRLLETTREMKDSGIEWMGEIPSNWMLSKIAEQCRIYGRIGYRGYTVKDLVDKEHGVITLGPSNIVDNKLDLSKQTYLSLEKYEESPEIKVYPGDIILVKTASVGKVAIIENTDEKLTLNPQLVVLKNIKCNNKFFYYLLVSPIIKKQIFDGIQNTVLPTITQAQIKKYCFPLPPLNEQQVIANYLDEQVGKIDGLISEQKQTIEKWKEYKKSLITETVTKGLNLDVEMKDSGIKWIGEIPKAWEVRKLKSIGDTIIGLTYSPEDVTDNGVLVLRSSNVQNGKIVLSDNVFVNKEIKDKLITQVGDILICSRNGSKSLIGKSALITESIAGNTFGAFMTVFRTKHYKFVYYALNSSIFSYYIGSFLTSTINQLTTENLKNIKIALPSSIEQQQIVDFLDEKCSKIDQTIEQKQVLIQQLEEYKQSLIYECVTGKRCVL